MATGITLQPGDKLVADQWDEDFALKSTPDSADTILGNDSATGNPCKFKMSDLQANSATNIIGVAHPSDSPTGDEVNGQGYDVSNTSGSEQVFTNFLTNVPDGEGSFVPVKVPDGKSGVIRKSGGSWEFVENMSIDTSALGEIATSVGSPSTIVLDYDNKLVKLVSAVILYQNARYTITENLDYSEITDNTIVFGIKKSTKLPIIIGSTGDTRDVAIIGSFRKDIVGVTKPASVNGNYSIGSEAVIPALPSFFYSWDAYSAGPTGSVNVDISLKKVVFNAAYIVFSGNYYLINAEVDYSAINTNSVLIVFNKKTHVPEVISLTTSNWSQYAMLGIIVKDEKRAVINGNYSINGNKVIPYVGQSDTVFSMGEPGSINVDMNAKTVAFSGAYLHYKGTNYIRTLADPLSWESITQNSIIIALDPTSLQPVLIGLTSAQDVAGVPVIGVIRKNKNSVFVNGVFSMSGNEVIPFTKVQLGDALTQMPFMFNGGYDCQMALEVEPDGADINQIYSFYDDLVANFPNYVTRRLLGNDAYGYPIYAYDIDNKTPDLGLYTDIDIKNRIICTTYCHGYEDDAALGAAMFFKDLMYNESNQGVLNAIKYNLKFTIIPLVNPTGFLDRTRKTREGIDINRSFPRGFVVQDPSSVNYGGPYPMSNLESQYVNDVIINATDAFCGIDRHNDSDYAGNGFCNWAGSNNNDVRKFLLSYVKWSGRYLVDKYNVDDFTGKGVARVNPSPLPGIEGRYCDYFPVSLILESDVSQIPEGVERQRNEANLYGNMILAICKKYLQYN